MMAAFFLFLEKENHNFLKSWINDIFQTITNQFKEHGLYPCVVDAYSELLFHPVKHDEYRIETTVASILYPTIALLAILLGDDILYEKIRGFKRDYLGHCNFQFWYADDSSEEDLYTNKKTHGYGLVDVSVEETNQDFISLLLKECTLSTCFEEMSAIKFGL